MVGNYLNMLMDIHNDNWSELLLWQHPVYLGTSLHVSTHYYSLFGEFRCFFAEDVLAKALSPITSVFDSHCVFPSLSRLHKSYKIFTVKTAASYAAFNMFYATTCPIQAFPLRAFSMYSGLVKLWAYRKCVSYFFFDDCICWKHERIYKLYPNFNLF